MLLYASTHFANVAGPNNTAPALSATPLSAGRDDQARIIEAVKRVEPAVVSLLVTVNGTRLVPLDPFSQMFGGGPAFRQPVQERTSGSGFVYTRNGLIITNAHVVPKGTSQITVVFANGDRIPGHLFSSNPAIDLALVKVDGYDKMPAPIEFADSTKLEAGQWAIGIGEPFELKQSVSLGVVSGFNRDEPITDETGNVRLFRELVAYFGADQPRQLGRPAHRHRWSRHRRQPVDRDAAGRRAGDRVRDPREHRSRRTVAELERSLGKTLNADSTGTGVGYIGVQLQPLEKNVRAQISYPPSAGAGVVIVAIPRGGPASKVDLSPGDVIQKINGRDVKVADDVISVVKSTKIGSTVRLQVWSAGTTKLVECTVEEEPASLYLQQRGEPANP